MAEAFVFAEGSALFWTGASTTSALATYAQNVSVAKAITYTSYRAPHGATYTTYPYRSAATLSIGQLHSQLRLTQFFEAQTGGGLHCHVKYLAPSINESGGMFLYSGTIIEHSLQGSDGQLAQQTFQAIFPTWSAY